MKLILLRITIILSSSLLFFQYVDAQKKLLVIGSSTSACFGPSTLDSCYLTRLQRYYQDNGTPIILDNRAVGGDNVYNGMPTNYTPPPGRNSPRPYNNITDGLTGNPDAVLVNYPSNGYDEYSVDEVINCLRTIKQTANNAGKPCYITTSQPRSDPDSYKTEAVRNKMAQIKDRILSEFGPFAINFWDGIANPANNLILDAYNADNIHLNNAGHRILFYRVLEKNIFSTQPSVPPPSTPSNPGTGLTYKYYEGDWNTLPDFSSLQPVKSGTVSNVDMSPRNRTDYYAFLWEGTINIPVSGNYTFETVSDDGSKLYFNSPYSAGANPVVNNDGLHPAQSVTGSVYINAGSYPIAISFFDKTGGEQIQVYWSGPGFSRQLIPNEAFTANSPAAGGGGGGGGGNLGYKYYEGDWNTLPDFNSLQPVKSGSVSNVDMSPRNRTDYYAFLWEGFINIPVSGNYTFETVSDDGSKLYFNTQYNAGANPLVNNDGAHPAQSASGSIYINAGSYPIAISFFEKNGDEQMQVYWSGPGFSRQLVPSGAFTSSASSTGGNLRYKYYEGDWNTLPDFNALQPVKSGSLSNVDMSPRNRADYYAFLWEGYINIPAAGNYTFETVSDDGSKLYFNSQYNAGANPLVNNDGLHPAQSAAASVYANPGSYPIAISFFEKNGGEQMQVYWSGPGIPRQLIPNAAFTASASFSFTNVNSNGLSQGLSGSTIGTDHKVIAYPNPFRQVLDIGFYNSNSNNKITAGIYDISGKLVHTQYFENIPAGSSTLRINLKDRHDISAGMYFLKVDVNGIPFNVLKLVKAKN